MLICETPLSPLSLLCHLFNDCLEVDQLQHTQTHGFNVESLRKHSDKPFSFMFTIQRKISPFLEMNLVEGWLECSNLNCVALCEEGT